MNYKELLDKTAVVVIGICKGVNEFVTKEGKVYYSVDVEAKGTKMPINIKLPATFDRMQLIEFDLCRLSCVIKPSFDRKGIVLEATGIIPAKATP